MKKVFGRIILVLLAVAVVALIIIGLMPSPIAAEVASVDQGPLRITIDEEGESRAHDRFVVAAPVSGRLERLELHDGDFVRKGAVIATIYPVPLNPRETSEYRARLDAAEALKREADARVARANVDYEQSLRDRQRTEQLAEEGLVSFQALELARNAETSAATELEAARFRAEAAASEERVARASLIALDREPLGGERVVTVRSPVAGRVLRVVEKSERVVVGGMPLVILGDPKRLEIVVDLLTTDAVKVKAGNPVLLEGWGGEAPMRARVRLIEAGAFTKVSALGVEEQRVNIVADLVDPPGTLGDGYRVEARIIIWEGANVLRVRSSALFRRGDGWSVFVVQAGRAWRRDVEVGHRSQFEAEVLGGLEQGDQVIVHPSNQLTDGAQVQVR
jgi:HlyD family secretion protein